MPVHRKREIDNLKKSVLSLAAIVEEQVWMAVRAFQGRDQEMAGRVIELDRTVDQREVEVEEECLKVLALYQPVATDLRFIVTVLKLNNDLERIGDLATNIAERAIQLACQPETTMPFDFTDMAEKARTMLRRSLDALISLSATLAHEVCAMDNEVDDLHRRMYDHFRRGVEARPELMSCYLQYLVVSRNLERIADHATNIAEDVIYMVEGRIVRHQTALYRDGEAKRN